MIDEELAISRASGRMPVTSSHNVHSCTPRTCIIPQVQVKEACGTAAAPHALAVSQPIVRAMGVLSNLCDRDGFSL